MLGYGLCEEFRAPVIYQTKELRCKLASVCPTIYPYGDNVPRIWLLKSEESIDEPTMSDPPPASATGVLGAIVLPCTLALLGARSAWHCMDSAKDFCLFFHFRGGSNHEPKMYAAEFVSFYVSVFSGIWEYLEYVGYLAVQISVVLTLRRC